MIDLDEVLRADADRWKAVQTVRLDLDAALEDAVATRHRRRRLVALAAAAAVVLVVAGVALIANLFDTGAPHRPAADAVPTVAHSNLSSAPAGVRLPGLGTPPADQRTLLRASGHGDQTWHIVPATGRRGEVYAVCLNGGSITINLPGHGGFDVDCTGTPAGASLPTLGRTVRISRAAAQEWRIAVFGR